MHPRLHLSQNGALVSLQLRNTCKTAVNVAEGEIAWPTATVCGFTAAGHTANMDSEWIRPLDVQSAIGFGNGRYIPNYMTIYIADTD